jgi:hypothetical protein
MSSMLMNQSSARRFVPLLALACTTLLTGCGGSNYTVVPVSGRVTLKGRPLAEVHVSFQPQRKSPNDPEPGPGSYAMTDADGRYRLKTVDPEMDGAVVGTHVVRLTMAEAGAGVDDADLGIRPQVLPPEAGDGSRRFEVPPGGTTEADFAF